MRIPHIKDLLYERLIHPVAHNCLLNTNSQGSRLGEAFPDSNISQFELSTPSRNYSGPVCIIRHGTGSHTSPKGSSSSESKSICFSPL